MGTFTLIQPRASADLYLIPNANGCNIDFTPVGEAENWECVDDPRRVPDDDDTYNYSTCSDLNYDLYALPNHTTEIGTINYVQVYSRAKSHILAQHADGVYKIIATDNACANVYKSDDIDLTTNYLTYNKTWTTNPRTDNAWLWTDIDNLQIGAECSSPSVTYPTQYLTIRPTAEFVTEHTVSGPGGGPNLNDFIDEEAQDGYNSTIHMNPAVGYPLNKSTFDFTNHVSETGIIINVAIFVCFNPTDAPEANYSRTEIRTHATDYQGDMEYVAGNEWTYISTNYAVNPFTSTAWTWAEIDALIGGVTSYGTAEYDNHCTQIYIVVSYNAGETNPEIRTTQCFAKVNYVPSDAECILNKPKTISVDHSINVKTLNFWNGTREVYGLNRSGKSMVLTGSEYQSNTCNKACPCEHIACIKDMGKNGSTITISGLRSLFNGDYKIRSFGWNHIGEKPEHYDWILELEYDD